MVLYDVNWEGVVGWVSSVTVKTGCGGGVELVGLKSAAARGLSPSGRTGCVWTSSSPARVSMTRSYTAHIH